MFIFKMRRILQVIFKSSSFLIVFLISLYSPILKGDKMAGGGYHSLFIKSDGSLWAMGGNDKGQLGDGTDNNRTSPVQIRSSGIVSVAAGEKHSLYIEDNGSLWGMGNNQNGQLGVSDTADRNTSVHIATDVISVAAGEKHTLFVKSNGSLWTMGSDAYGQLGNGAALAQVHTPGEILTSGVIRVAAGTSHSLFIKTDGSLWGMGRNNKNQLGNTGGNEQDPVQIASSGVVSVSGGLAHTLFTNSDGNLSGIGGNQWGQLGNNTQIDQNVTIHMDSNVSSVVAGEYHTLYMKTDGSFYSIGKNQGALGNGEITLKKVPVLIGNDILNIAAGYSHSMYETSHGRLWGTGLNASGQLGIGSTIDQLSPQQFKAADTSQSFTGAVEDQIFTGVLFNPVLNSNVSYTKTSGPYQSGDSNKIEYVQSFTLDSNGSFSLLGRPDWNGTLIFEWHATLDSNNSVVSGQASVTLRAENDAPVITILDRNLNAVTTDFNQTSVPENQTLVGYINVVDDNNTVPDLNSTHADGSKFSIDSTNLTDLNGDGLLDYPIKINGTGFNYENPTDLGGTSGDRKYFLNIFANDGSTQTEVELKIDITDVAETPLLSSHAYSINIREDARLSTDTDSWYQKNGNSYPIFTASDPDQATTTLTWSMVNQGPQKGTMQWSTDSQMLNASSNALTTPKGNKVYFNYIPDANKTGSDSFTVKVEDEASNTDTISFTVTITAVNDDAPIFTSSVSSTSNPFVIASGSTQSFHTLQTSDSDDALALFSYSKVAGFDSQYFDVNSSSGQVSSIGITSSITHPDEDGDGIYRFQVRATETGTNETVDQWVYVEINEPPHFVDKNGNIITAPISVVISEDESPVSWDTVWAANLNGLQAIDPGTNGSANTTITTWSVNSQGAKGVVTVNGVAGLIDYQPNSNEFGSDTFTITAQDASGLTGLLDFNITIEAVNDLPLVERSDSSPSTNLSLYEGSRFVLNFQGNDTIDSPGNSLAIEHKWQISGNDSNRFYIEENGSLYFQNLPDRENPLDLDQDNRYELEIKVSDDGTNFSAPFSLNVLILNVNEPPVFSDHGSVSIADPFLEKSGYFTRVEVPENSTLIYDPNCSDPEGNSFTYNLGLLSDFNITNADFSTTSISPFAVDPTTGQITLSKSIDYEDPNSLVNSTTVLSGTTWWANASDPQIKAGFHLELNATDNGAPQQTASHRILVVITDVNEPVVFQPSVSYSVSEEDQFITTLTASDPEGDVVIFGVEPGYKDDEYFSINQATGQLSFQTSPRNFENPQDNGINNSYEIQVYAQSSGTSKVSQDIVVNVLNANDAPSLDREGSSRISVLENRSLVLTFDATDEDHNFSYPDLVYAVDGKEVRFQNHSDTPSNPFSDGTLLHNQTGAKAVQVADFNRDGFDDILELNSTDLLRLYLNSGTNQFDPPIPVTSSIISINQILVSDLSGDGYPDVLALDSINERILAWSWNHTGNSFTPLVGGGGSNEVAALTGGFSPKSIRAVDVDTDGMLDILIDSNGSSRVSWIKNLGGSTFGSPMEILSSTAYAGTIFDLDVGDLDGDGDMDIVLATALNISVMENTGSGQFLPMVTLYNDPNGSPFRVKLIDLDGDKSLDVIASVDRASNGFQNQNVVLVNLSTHPFSHATPLYFSTGNLISSFDGGDLDNDKDLDVITISQSGNLEFFENAGNGVLSSLDTIQSPKGNIVSVKLANFNNRLDDLKFSISGGKDSALFEFRPNFSPSIWFKNPPDYEVPLSVNSPGFGPNEYQVIIQADSVGLGGDIKSVNHTLIVEVTNENDNSPVISTPINFNHNENAVSVTTLLASDKDVNSLTWTFNGGRDVAGFALSSGGNLSFRVPPDYENPGSLAIDNQYLVNIRVSDGLYFVDQNLTIDITNLNDTPPKVHNPELNGVYQIPVLENVYHVLDLNISDADLNVGVLSKNIIPGKDSALFTITGNDDVEFLAPPDHENPNDANRNNVYEFDLNISDQIHSQIIPVFVEVINVNDVTPQWLVTGGNYKIAENQDFIIDLNASDDFNNSIIFSLDSSSPDYQFFDLNASSGILNFISGLSPNFESPADLSPGANGLADGVYEITVNLRDPDRNATSQKFVFTVEDLDEFPSFTNSVLSLNEDDSISFGAVDFNITDPENEVFNLNYLSDPAYGTLTSLGSGNFRYQADKDYYGQDSFTLKLEEGGITQNFQISIQVNPTNDVPLLKVDEFDYLLQNRSPMALDVLTNDSSFPDDNNSETLRVVSWEIDFSLNDARIAPYDWSSAFPVAGSGPFSRGDLGFTFTPPAGFYGPVILTYEVSDGNLTAKSQARINVTQSPEVPGWKYYDEFGYFYLAANNWMFHDKLGWSYVVNPSSLLTGESWCWSENVGWYWTGRYYFDYIYVNEFKKWMRWQGGVNDPAGWSIMTDYDTLEVLTPAVFQIKRASSTISAFTSSDQVSDYVQNSSIFTAQEKKQILRELIFTKSSKTLQSYGIQLKL